MAAHGTRYRYDREYCRCNECKAANAKHQKLLREKLLYKPIPRGYHGKASTYINYGCRCKRCAKAHKLAWETQQLRREDRAK